MNACSKKNGVIDHGLEVHRQRRSLAKLLGEIRHRQVLNFYRREHVYGQVLTLCFVNRLRVLVLF